MKIATIKIQDITHEDFLKQLQSPDGNLVVEIADENYLKIVDVDVINEFIKKTPVAVFLKKTFDYAAHHLKKNDIEVKLLQSNNVLNVTARKSIDISDGYSIIKNKELKFNFTINTGKLTGNVFKTKVFVGDISSEVPQEIKDELKSDFNITVTGTWGNLTVNGTCLVSIEAISPSTVFVGNNDNGFVFE